MSDPRQRTRLDRARARCWARRGGELALVAAVLLASAGGRAASAPAAEVVVTGVARPLQLAFDGRTLVILSPGSRGDSAGELHRVDLDGELPIDLTHQPRVRIPFLTHHPTTLGSLAVDPISHQVFLGEENGNVVYRVTGEGPMTVYASGLRRLGGGGTLAFDHAGRLIIVDYVDPVLSRRDERVPPGLEQFRDEDDYRGPLVFRLNPDPTIPLPRRLEVLAPLFPRAWGGRAGGGALPWLLSVAPLPNDDLVFLSSAGGIYRLSTNGQFGLFTRLHPGQYNRTNMVAGNDGNVFVSGGFHVGEIFRVAPDGAVTTIARNLADPEGIAVDSVGDVYVAESARHRIVRIPHL